MVVTQFNVYTMPGSRWAHNILSSFCCSSEFFHDANLMVGTNYTSWPTFVGAAVIVERRFELFLALTVLRTLLPTLCVYDIGKLLFVLGLPM